MTETKASYITCHSSHTLEGTKLVTIEWIRPDDPAPVPRDLTPRQRGLCAILRSVANDMDCNGTRDEQHSASLLRIATDAIQRGYEAELVALARAWRLEREGRG